MLLCDFDDWQDNTINIGLLAPRDARKQVCKSLEKTSSQNKQQKNRKRKLIMRVDLMMMNNAMIIVLLWM